MLLSQCLVSDCKKLRCLKNQEPSGLLSNLLLSIKWCIVLKI